MRRALLIFGLLLVCGTAFAQTPDGETPAEETICDVLQADGVTKGLYGLCVAYCEAHDADLLSMGRDPAELDVPNRKILENYNRKKTAGDPDMPCVQVEGCPCWTSAQLAELTPPTPLQADGNLQDACWDGDYFGYPVTLIECIDYDDQYGFCFWQMFVTDLGGSSTFCWSVNWNQAVAGGPPNVRVDDLTTEEADSCVALVEARAAVDATPDVWSCFLP